MLPVLILSAWHRAAMDTSKLGPADTTVPRVVNGLANCLALLSILVMTQTNATEIVHMKALARTHVNLAPTVTTKSLLPTTIKTVQISMSALLSFLSVARDAFVQTNLAPLSVVVALMASCLRMNPMIVLIALILMNALLLKILVVTTPFATTKLAPTSADVKLTMTVSEMLVN
jgi:hypothetical protein